MAVGRPPNHAASRACSMARATRATSRRATSRSLGKRLTEASATMMPVMATTTRISMRVKPLVPVPDVRRIAFSAARAVGAEAEDVDLALHARREVLVVATPGIARQPVEVAALFPVRRLRLGRRTRGERAQSLLGGGIEAVVEAIELERLADRAHVGLRRHALRLVRPIHEARHDQRGEDAEDHHDHEDFDQRKAAEIIGVRLQFRYWVGFSGHLVKIIAISKLESDTNYFPISWFSWKMGSNIASTIVSTAPPMKTIIAGSKRAAKAARRMAMSFCCWRAARSRASSRRPLASPLAIRCTITGGKAAVAPSARASGMPSRTPRAAVVSASRIGTSVITPVPASSDCRIGTRLPTRIESVAARRAESRLRSTRPTAGARHRKRWMAAREAGRFIAAPRAMAASEKNATHASQVACRNPESQMSARVSTGSCWCACWKTCTTWGRTYTRSAATTSSATTSTMTG